MEPIIQNPDKYNLIVFSASWCGPCHKQIPLLKEIYNDLSGKVEITYISMDKPEQVGSWMALMEKESIPWRSLLANGQVAMEEKHMALIPSSILVYPDGKMDNIDVRKAEDKAKLYKLASE